MEGTGTGARVTLLGGGAVTGRGSSGKTRQLSWPRFFAAEQGLPWPPASLRVSTHSLGRGRTSSCLDVVAISCGSRVWGHVQATGVRISKDPPALNDAGISQGLCREQAGARQDSVSRTLRTKHVLTSTSSSASQDPPAALPTGFAVLSWCRRTHFPATLLNGLPRGSAPGMLAKAHARGRGAEAGRREGHEPLAAHCSPGGGACF